METVIAILAMVCLVALFCIVFYLLGAAMYHAHLTHKQWKHGMNSLTEKEKKFIEKFNE